MTALQSYPTAINEALQLLQSCQHVNNLTWGYQFPTPNAVFWLKTAHDLFCKMRKKTKISTITNRLEAQIATKMLWFPARAKGLEKVTQLLCQESSLMSWLTRILRCVVTSLSVRLSAAVCWWLGATFPPAKKRGNKRNIDESEPKFQPAPHVQIQRSD